MIGNRFCQLQIMLFRVFRKNHQVGNRSLQHDAVNTILAYWLVRKQIQVASTSCRRVCSAFVRSEIFSGSSQMLLYRLLRNIGSIGNGFRQVQRFSGGFALSPTHLSGSESDSFGCKMLSRARLTLPVNLFDRNRIPMVAKCYWAYSYRALV